MRGQKRKLPKTITMQASFHNRFDIEVIDAQTGEIKQKAQAENVILNAFWNQNSIFGEWFYYIQYGSGNGTPANSDTNLFSYISKIQMSSEGLTYLDKNTMCNRGKITLSEVTAVGSTLTEVGVSNSNNVLLTHAMLKDMNGNPISIVKTDTDIINIYATVFVHTDLDEIIRYSYYYYGSRIESGFLRTLAGCAHNSVPPTYFNRMTLSNNRVSTPNLYYSNTTTSPVVATKSTGGAVYDKTAKTLTMNFARLGASASFTNNDFHYVVVGGDYSGDSKYNITEFVFPVESVSNGSDIIGEAIGTGDGVTCDFKTDFSKVSSPTVYINGVAQTSGVSFDLNLPFAASKSKTLFKAYEYIQDELAPIMMCYINGYDNILSIPSESNRTIVYENLYNDRIQITKLVKLGDSVITSVAMSNDLINWTAITLNTDISSEVGGMKYLRIVSGSGQPYWPGVTVTTSMLTDNNIHFASPPASGAIITMDYHTATIAKDVNHVFDFSFVIQFGEYTPT